MLGMLGMLGEAREVQTWQGIIHARILVSEQTAVTPALRGCGGCRRLNPRIREVRLARVRRHVVLEVYRTETMRIGVYCHRHDEQDR